MGVSKYDNETKRETLLKGIDKQVAQVKKATYMQTKTNRIFDDEGVVCYENKVNAFEEMAKPYREGFNLIDCALRLNESKYRRAKKVRSKITELVLNNSAIFITLTFNDDFLLKTSPQERRRVVQRYLKRNCLKYVANVDFGALNGREHYHAVVSNDIEFSSWYKYGSVNVERVRPCEDSPKRISKYITKLTNHALKVQGLQPRLIYSRDTI